MTRSRRGMGTKLLLAITAEAAMLGLMSDGTTAAPNAAETGKTVTYQSALGECSLRGARITAEGGVEVKMNTTGRTAAPSPERASVFTGKNTVAQVVAVPIKGGEDTTVFRATLNPSSPTGVSGTWGVSISNPDADPAHVTLAAPQGVGPEEMTGCGVITVTGNDYQPEGGK